MNGDEVPNEVKEAYYVTGYTRCGNVQETDTTPEVKFVFTPLTVSQNAAWESKLISAHSVSQITTVLIEMVMKHIVEWDVTKLVGDGTRTSVDFTQKSEIERMDPYIIAQIAEIIKGSKAIDGAKVKN